MRVVVPAHCPAVGGRHWRYAKKQGLLRARASAGDHTPLCAVPTHCERPRCECTYCPYVGRRNIRHVKEVVVTRADVRAGHYAPSGAVPTLDQRAVEGALVAVYRKAHGPGIVG